MVLVMGDAGYIDSHMVRRLKDQGLALVVLDDLRSGFADAVSGAELIVGDVADAVLLDSIFTNYRIDAVIHFASFIQVGGVSSQASQILRQQCVENIILATCNGVH